MEKKIETKKDEIRYFTSDPKRMLDKYLVNDVVQTWYEDFTDEDTQEVVSIERKQLLFGKGLLIDRDLLAKISFHLQAGDIKEVEVSNQKRLGYENEITRLRPWLAQVKNGEKNYKLLLYGSSVTNVIEILNDYLELNYHGGYSINTVKLLDMCIILTDNLKEQEDEAKKEENKSDGLTEKKFYQLEVKIIYSDETDTTAVFVVHTYDTDKALMIISHYLKMWEEKKAKEHEEKGYDKYKIRDFKLIIEKAGPMPVGAFVPKDFSMAYKED